MTRQQAIQHYSRSGAGQPPRPRPDPASAHDLQSLLSARPTVADRNFKRVEVSRGFTLLEVMIAIAFIGIAMLSLLSLHDRNLHSVMHAQEMSRAVTLAQALMSQAETERYPDLGKTGGNFEKDYPGKYPGYQWQRVVSQTANLPDLRTVTVRILYAGGGRSFEVSEIMHNPSPQPPANASGQNGQNDQNGNQ
jgi:general secretion pathway protein I